VLAISPFVWIGCPLSTQVGFDFAVSQQGYCTLVGDKMRGLMLKLQQITKVYKGCA